MLSLTGEYALRAMIFLARHAGGGPIPGAQVAESAGVPRKYLSTILADLVRAGLLDGTRGKSGGFHLARKAKSIRLTGIVSPFEPVNANRKTCPFDNTICSDSNPCAAHERWKEVNMTFTRFLTETTLHDVAVKGPGRKKAPEKHGGAP